MYRHHLEKLVRTRLDDVLVDEGILDRPKLEAVQAEQDQKDCLLSDVLIDSGTIEEWDLAKLIASHYALPFVDVLHYQLPALVADVLPLEWCRKHSFLPFDQFGKALAIACVEVPSAELIEEITQKTGASPFVYVAVRRAVREVLDESVKRRGNRAGPSASVFATMSAAPREPGRGTAGAHGTAPAEPDLAPLDLPRISLQLDASAAVVGAHDLTPTPPASETSAPRRPPIERFGRPIAAPPSVPAASQAPRTSRVGAPAAPVPVAAAASRAQPAPHGASIGASNGATNGSPTVPAAARAASRPAPVLPSAPKPAKGGGPGQAGWESIFDIGDDAVRRSTPGE